MKRYLLAATALAVVATPAVARDRAAYFGLEVGGLWVTDTEVESGDLEELGDLDINHKLGVDGDMIAGYDFGMFRAEAEFGYKRSHHDEYEFGQGTINADGRSSVYSLMLNGMVDVGPDEGFQFYAGAGAGYAQVIHVLEEDDEPGSFKIKDRGFAWQLVAGVRTPVSQYFDVGLKYRYFDAGNVSDDEDGLDLDSEYKSHSVLVSLIHNFNVPEPPPPPPPVIAPPPPPPPPPETQTCPDGSVVLATDVCPMPPPPPPPPPPEPERG